MYNLSLKIILIGIFLWTILGDGIARAQTEEEALVCQILSARISQEAIRLASSSADFKVYYFGDDIGFPFQEEHRLPSDLKTIFAADLMRKDTVDHRTGVKLRPVAFYNKLYNCIVFFRRDIDSLTVAEEVFHACTIKVLSKLLVPPDTAMTFEQHMAYLRPALSLHKSLEELVFLLVEHDNFGKDISNDFMFWFYVQNLEEFSSDLLQQGIWTPEQLRAFIEVSFHEIQKAFPTLVEQGDIIERILEFTGVMSTFRNLAKLKAGYRFRKLFRKLNWNPSLLRTLERTQAQLEGASMGAAEVTTIEEAAQRIVREFSSENRDCVYWRVFLEKKFKGPDLRLDIEAVLRDLKGEGILEIPRVKAILERSLIRK